MPRPRTDASRAGSLPELLAGRLPADLTGPVDPDREPFPVVEPGGGWPVGDRPDPGRLYRDPDGTIRRACDRSDPIWRDYTARGARSDRLRRWLAAQPETADMSNGEVTDLARQVRRAATGRDDRPM